jgi:O-antigen/teichoic acid export membrane protein
MSAGGDTAAQGAVGKGLMQRALSLGAAKAFDYGLQFLLPVVLTRALDAEAFGEYRLLWLVAATVMAVITLAVPGSLFYFLPRSNSAEKRLYINQTAVFLTVAATIAACAVSAWNPWLPEKVQVLGQYGGIVPAFIWLWVTAALLDVLPVADERVSWQVRATIGLSALRAVALSLAAILTGDLGVIFMVLVAFVAFKFTLLLVYIGHFHGLRGPLLRGSAFRDQLRHAAPFVIASALYGLQAQADQWVAVGLFSMAVFAAFSVGAVLAPLVTLCRQSVSQVFLPMMSRLQANGDIPGMIGLNSRANMMVGTLLYPLLAFVFVFAEEIVTIVYTAKYIEAAPVMRVYIVGLAALVINLSGITLLLREGVFQMRMSFVVLLISIALSWIAALHYGLPGAAAGSVTAIYLDRLATLRRISVRTGISFGRLQDWGSLGLLLLYAVVAAGFAWALVDAYFAPSGPFIRVVVGAASVALAFGTMYGLYWIGRARLAGAAGTGQ